MNTKEEIGRAKLLLIHYKQRAQNGIYAPQKMTIQLNSFGDTRCELIGLDPITRVSNKYWAVYFVGYDSGTCGFGIRHDHSQTIINCSINQLAVNYASKLIPLLSKSINLDDFDSTSLGHLDDTS